MAEDSLLGGSMFQALGEARSQDMQRERYERERYNRRQRNPSFGDMMKQSLMAHTTKAFTAPIGEAIGGAITSVIQTPFQRNAKEFEAREDVSTQRRNIKNNKRHGNSLSNIQTKIDQFDGTQQEFWRDYATKRSTARLTSELPGNNISPDDVPFYSRSIHEQARLHSEKNVTYTDPRTGEEKTAPRYTKLMDAYNNAVQEYEEAASQGDYASVLKMANKRPENIIEAALGFGKRIISRQSKEEHQTELDRKSFEVLENSALIRENDEFKSAFKLFKDAGDFKGLEDYLNTVRTNPNPEAITEVTAQEVKITDEKLRIFEQTETKTYNRKTNTYTTTLTPYKVISTMDLRTPKGQIKALDSGFNYITVANKFLNPEVVSALTKDLKNRKDENGDEAAIQFLSPQTVEEYTIIRDMMNTLMTENKNIKNDFINQVVLATQREFNAQDTQKQAEMVNKLAAFGVRLSAARKTGNKEEIEKINTERNKYMADTLGANLADTLGMRQSMKFPVVYPR